MITKVIIAKPFFSEMKGNSPAGSTQTNGPAAIAAGPDNFGLGPLCGLSQIFSLRPIFRKQTDHLPVESRNVIRLSAGYQIAVAHTFFVDPDRARILQVRPQRRP
jgi:hypothetical protein